MLPESRLPPVALREFSFILLVDRQSNHSTEEEIMTTRATTVVALSCLALAAVAAAQTPQHLEARLRGAHEVPSISSTGHALFQATLDSSGDDATQIAYTLDYAGFSNPLTQAHIHFAEPGVNGGIVLFLCSNLSTAPAGVQPCPPSPTRIQGTLTRDDVVGTAAAQGIAAGPFIKVLRAIRAGAAYVNVHSTQFQAGEIRGQIAVVQP
jgi:hypothetical protein